ncbi:hypothetical protein EI77_02538 [Prosthecobacter fusiformis]|uniref:Uncharacterized protein n=1 Tax=Prosthecobacter fusiformis TaxID=48464 RepID=A0A4R7RZJ9_9BACT|nr:hypothetical protein EI77_02538 [Prosthecobacter fusiformis]
MVHGISLQINGTDSHSISPKLRPTVYLIIRETRGTTVCRFNYVYLGVELIGLTTRTMKRLKLYMIVIGNF